MENTAFSLHSVLHLEKDLECALEEIVRVKRVNDLTQSMLKQSNKETIIKLVNTLSHAFTQNSELLKLASADIDKLKTSQIRLQEDLLSAKEEILTSRNEQLDTVKCHVYRQN